ncbi:MAG: DUF5672 family protein [Bacteroidales bacterium]|nr:DUF5672 family protein [Bacteroidales bacterium]
MSQNSIKEVVVVIPIYTDELSFDELHSLSQAMKILGSYPIIIVKPSSLTPDKLKNLHPELQFKSFPNHYFNGIKAYNTLMLSTQFYKEFLDYEYLLIYQLDAYVFRDDLIKWCRQGYDYIGGPWIKREVYNYPFVSSYMKFERWVNSKLKRPDRQKLYNKVGNGGFSLRKVNSHYNALVHCKEIASGYIEKKQYHLYNEDVFWSVEVNNWLDVPFRYPDYLTALEFSFDKHPQYCYKLTGNRLPFGCHCWNKKHVIGFWRKFILPDGDQNL